MAFFVYSFVTSEGIMERSTGTFGTIDELYNKIELNGGSIYKAVNLPSFFETLYKAIVIGKAKPKDISEFVRNISVYLEGGISIQDAVTDLGNSTKSKAIKSASKDILDTLNNGYTMSESLSRTGIFPDIVISSARIGEASGSLDKTLGDAANYIDRNIEIKSSVKNALIYPAFSLFSITGAFVFWIVFILPKLTELLLSFNAKLPTATRMLIALSNFMQNDWIFIIATVVLILIAFPIMLKIEKVRLMFDKLIWKSPIIGMIVRYSQTAFYFQYLSLLTESGVSLTEAIGTMELAISNKFFLKSISKITKDLEAGLSLSESFKNAKVFEPIAVRMSFVGEKTGNIDTQMKKLSEIYYKKVQQMVEIIGKLIEPIILVFIGGMFVFFILALITPIYSMLGNMTR